MQEPRSTTDGDPWAKNSSEDGIPYYVSQDGADTSWDHPMLPRILSMLEDCNRIEYAAYKAATKLRMLQKRLNWDALTVYPVASIMQHHALKPGEADTLISIGKVSAVISDVFAYIAWIGARSNGFSFDVCSELTLNLFINIFDKKRRGQVRVLSVQTFLCLLCKDRPQGKLRYLFRQVSDHNNCCSRVKLATLLKEMCAIMEYLDEGWKFGLHTVGPAVESCFSSMCPRQQSSSGIGVGPMRRQVCFGLTEEKYLQWMAQQPQNLVWLFINHRLADSEHVVHNVQCRACRQTPIVGLCYVCLQCWNVQLCQTCFLLGRPVSGHKKSHQMEEHCAQLTYSERFSVAVNRLLSVMRLSRPCVKKGPSFLPLNSSPQVAGDLIPVLTRSEDGSSSRDNPSPLPPPPPPPPQEARTRGGRPHGDGAYAIGAQIPSCSSRSSGVVVDPDLDPQTPNSNWFCQSPNIPPSACSSVASTHSSASPLPANDSGSGDAKLQMDEPNVGRRKSVGINILPVHQRELQSILWHFEEEQKQLKSVLGHMEPKAEDIQSSGARQELQQCSSELGAQLGRLRTVLKNYMRCSVAVGGLQDFNGNPSVDALVGPIATSSPPPPPPSTEPLSSPSPSSNLHGLESPRYAPVFLADTVEFNLPMGRPHLESTAVCTPGERVIMPFSPIAQSGQKAPGAFLDPSDTHQPSPIPGKVVFRVKKLPTSLQMRSGVVSTQDDPVISGRPRGPGDFYACDAQDDPEPSSESGKILNGYPMSSTMNERPLPPDPPKRAPLAEMETLGSIMSEQPTPRKLNLADFPAISLGDLSSTLLTLTQDLEIPRGTPSHLPYDQQAKRVSMINRELEGILRELDAVYPSVKFSSGNNE